MAICRWNEQVGLAVNDQRWSRYLCDAAVGLPSENPLQLTYVTLCRGIPLHADGHIFVDLLTRRACVIDDRDDSLRRFFWSHTLADKNFKHLGFRPHRIRATC